MSLWPLHEGRRFDEAVAGAGKLLRITPDLSCARFVLGQALFFPKVEPGMDPLRDEPRFTALPRRLGFER